MKTDKIYIPAIAATLMLGLSACDDNVMEWKGSDPTVKPTELPMELAEKIAKYDYIKNYMAEYHPNTPITVGMGLDNYLGIEEYAATVNENFQGVTFGNAMKHQSIVASNGAFNWSKVDEFLALNTGLPIHGHNLLWHTQQQQNYMRSLIAPEIEIVGTPDSDILNILQADDSNFEGGTTGNWGCWGQPEQSPSASVVEGGHDSKYAAQLVNNADGGEGQEWRAQFAYTCSTPFDLEKTYKIRFYAKCDNPAGTMQIQYQNSNSYGSQGCYARFNVGTNWTLSEAEFQPKEEATKGAPDRVIINFGAVAGTYLVDDIEFGEKMDLPSDPDATRPNLIPNGTFDNDTEGWAQWNGTGKDWDADEGMFAKGCMKIVNEMSEPTNQWKMQIHSDLREEIISGTTFYVSYYIKTAAGEGSVRCSTTGQAYYQGDQTVTPAWTRIEWVVNADGNRDGEVTGLNFDIAAVPNTYYIDNVVVSTTPFSKQNIVKKRAQSLVYKIKTPEEKKQILLDAMEAWIKEAMTHMGDKCTSWDVINEPIGDDSKWRGIDGGWMSGDSEPVETREDGLTLNWANDAGNGHFYWGYYIGKEYAPKAFEFARKYSTNNADLYVNEYNLETSDRKRAALIEFVKYIDANGGHVDGIGTQMHVQKNITKEQVDKMFKELATTGKKVRITELDVALGTEAKTLTDYELQGEVFHMILTSYFENVPEAQQGGITIWSLTDAPEEHEYWLKGDEPNIFDANYGRKIAYKRVCDAIAGRDLGEEFTSPDYSQTGKDK